jgi:hypothetical protein
MKRIFNSAQLVRSVIVLCALVLSFSSSAEIFVIKHSDGSVTFTTRSPRNGENGVLFVPKAVGFKTEKRLWDDDSQRAMLSFSKKSYDELITSNSITHEVDPALIKAIIHAESAFNPKAVSRRGAQGLMQLMPPTAKEVGVSDSFSPKQNIRGGTIYLKRLIERYSGNLAKAIAAYNAGPGAVDTFKGIPPYKETRDYVKKVLSLRKSYQGNLS